MHLCVCVPAVISEVCVHVHLHMYGPSLTLRVRGLNFNTGIQLQLSSLGIQGFILQLLYSYCKRAYTDINLGLMWLRAEPES